jgi:hypothetical protein
MYLVFKKLRKVLEEQEKYSLFLAGKRGSGKSFLKLFDVLIQWPVSKQFTRRIMEQYQIIYPDDLSEIKKQTSKTVLIIAVLDLMLFIILFALKPSLFKAIITITWIYVANNQTLYLILEKYQINLDIQFKDTLDNIRHSYQYHQDVELAVFKTLEEAPYPINLHIKRIHDVISSEDPEEEVHNYNDITPNRFLKIFTSLCVSMMKFGDKKIGNNTIFLSNLSNLKRELNIEINRKKNISWLFSGLVFLLILPINFLEAIREWAVKCFSNLAEYYSGAFGIATVVLIFLTTIGGFNLINKLKETERISIKNYRILEWISNKWPFSNLLNNLMDKNYGQTNNLSILLKRSGESITVKQFHMKRIIYAIVTVFLCISIFFSIHGQKRDIYLKNTENINYYSSVLSKEQESVVKDIIVQYVTQYRSSKITKDEMENQLIKEGVVKSREIATLTADEIVKRVNSYQAEYFKWYELVISLLISALAYQVPYIILIIMKRVREKVMEDEVIQFKSIISMLMYIDRMTIRTILEWMETFSCVFKKSIQKCLDDLQEGDIESLENLKKDEPFQPFVRLIESIQVCDVLPIERAFDEIENDRDEYQENRKIENEILTKDRALIGNVIASIPAVITISFYLIIPWVIEGLTYFLNQMEQMKTIY